MTQKREEPEATPEADLSGPWKLEPVPGHPGAVAVLRAWESLERGDVPEGVFLDHRTAEAFAAVLPLLEREPFRSLLDLMERRRRARSQPN